MWVRHSVLAGFTCHDLQYEKIERLPLFSHSCTPGFNVLATAYTMKSYLIILQTFIKFFGWQFRILKRKSPQTFSLCSAFEPF